MVSAPEGNFGDVVTFSCSGGWHLVGVSQLTCTTSGHWDNITPYCVGSGNNVSVHVKCQVKGL